MKFIINTIVLSAFFLFTQQCGKENITKDPEGEQQVPECIQTKIHEISQHDVWNPPAKVFRYSYRGQNVYFIPQRCCDIPSQLFDENCEKICEPDGGFTGKGNGACPDFFTARTGEKLLWEDKR